MRTNIDIDDKLMKEAMLALSAKTKKEAVVIALQDAVRRKKQLEIRSLRGIGWEGNLDDMRRG